MYFIRNNKSILFQQIKNWVMVYRGTLNQDHLIKKTFYALNQIQLSEEEKPVRLFSFLKTKASLYDIYIYIYYKIVSLVKT